MIWYKTIFLPSATKKGFSSKEIQKQLGLKRYEPVWTTVHKPRKALGKRDTRYNLEGWIEMDEGNFTIDSSEIAKEKEGEVPMENHQYPYWQNQHHWKLLKLDKKSSHCRYLR